MAFNITGFDEDLFFTINTAVGTSLFFVIVLTPLVLCVLCVLALIYTKNINKKLKVLLINIFAAEICTWLFWTLTFLGFPLRFHTHDGFNWICSLETSIFLVGGNQKFTSGSIYAVVVYIFVKYGERKLNWYVIIAYIAVSWVVITMIIGILPYIKNFEVSNSNGICATTPDTILFKAAVPFGVLLTAIFLGVVVVFCVLTGVYIKRNTLEGNVEVKKAVAKVLVYLTVVTVLTFITSLLSPVSSAVRETAGARYGIVGEIMVGYIFRIIYSGNAFLTPIMAIIFLKPVRIAFKEIGKGIIRCDCIKRCSNKVMDVEMTIQH